MPMEVDYEKLDLVRYPAIVLRKQTKEVKEGVVDLKKLIPRMFEIMYKYDGVGLAATQVGLSLRLFLMNVEHDRNKKAEKVFVNPVIVEVKEYQEGSEGCLSVPGIYVGIKRARIVRVRAKDENFQPFEVELENLAARAVQHEVDHLNNILIIDRITPAQKIKIASELEKLENEYYEKNKVSKSWRDTISKYGK